MIDFHDLLDDGDDDDPERELADEVTVAFCPYCGAEVELILDPGGAATQRYVEDCEVCCRPWNVHVHWVDGHAHVDLRTEDET